MLMDVYTGDELDKIDDWIEKISDGNKVMETLHTDIHKLKVKPKRKFWKQRSIIVMRTLTS